MTTSRTKRKAPGPQAEQTHAAPIAARGGAWGGDKGARPQTQHNRCFQELCRERGGHETGHGPDQAHSHRNRGHAGPARLDQPGRRGPGHLRDTRHLDARSRVAVGQRHPIPVGRPAALRCRCSCVRAQFAHPAANPSNQAWNNSAVGFMDSAANVESPPLAGHYFRPVGVLPHKVPLPGPVPSAFPSTVVVRHFYKLSFHFLLRCGCALTIHSSRRLRAARLNSGVRHSRCTCGAGTPAR